jgi:hypothetical protein
VTCKLTAKAGEVKTHVNSIQVLELAGKNPFIQSYLENSLNFRVLRVTPASK